MPHSSKLFHEWQLAERESLALDHLLQEANLAYAEGRAAAPGSHLVDAANEWRALARALQQLALGQLRDETDAMLEQLRAGLLLPRPALET